MSAYFIDLVNDNNLGSSPEVLSISQPTTATRINLTSFGKIDNGFDGSVWRLRNGTGTTVNGDLIANTNQLINTYELPENTDTFVISPEASGNATHILEADGIRKIKAASPNSFAVTNIIGEDAYEIIGGSGNDSLRGAGNSDTLLGAAGDDTLAGRGQNDVLIGGEGDDIIIGEGGADTLTGGAGSDKFQFDDRGTDEITDFSLSDGDVFQIDTSAYAADASASIFIDTSSNIRMMGTGNFAYAIDKDRLFYDADGDWSNRDDRSAVADTNDFGTPSSANFEFI